LISALNLLNPNQKLLIVLDNLNFLQPSANFDTTESRIFVEAVNLVLHDFKNVHILFSTNFYIKDIDNMKVKRLFLLSKDQPFELLIKKIPCNDTRLKLEDMSSVRELHEYTL